MMSFFIDDGTQSPCLVQVEAILIWDSQIISITHFLINTTKYRTCAQYISSSQIKIYMSTYKSL